MKYVNEGRNPVIAHRVASESLHHRQCPLLHLVANLSVFAVDRCN